MRKSKSTKITKAFMKCKNFTRAFESFAVKKFHNSDGYLRNTECAKHGEINSEKPYSACGEGN